MSGEHLTGHTCPHGESRGTCYTCQLKDEIERLSARLKQYEDLLRDITAENDRLRSIEAAAQNLLQVKGRHHTVEAYLQLEEAMK
jgi:hypothetical protein